MKKKRLEFNLVTTRGGDRGESFLYSGEKAVKYDDVFNVLGDLDELNSFLGVVRNLNLHVNFISKIQSQILNMSSIIATTTNSDLYEKLIQIEEKDIDNLELLQYNLMDSANIPQRFILPGEKKDYTAHIDVARSVCRRCERNVVYLIREKGRSDLYNCQIYLNRLSDLLFTLARYEDTF